MTATGQRPNHRWPKGDLDLVREDVLRDGVRLAHAKFPTKWKWTPKLKNCDLEDVDLQSPQISRRLFSEGFIESSTFKRVSFDDVRIKGIRFANSAFTSCVFSGGIRRATFTNCRFEDCAFGQIGFYECIFEDCELIQLDSKESRWEACRLQRVTGDGKMDGDTIVRSTFTDVDWSAMWIIDSNMFVENRFERTKLPSRPDNFVLNTASLAATSNHLNASLSDIGRVRYQKIADIWSRQRTNELIAEDFFEDLPLADRKAAMAVLYKMRERQYE